MKKVLTIVVACGVLGLSSRARAADFYVDPASVDPSGAGTAAAPWRTLQEVVAAGKIGSTVKAGDTVHLRSGYHGELLVTGGTFSPPVTITADPGQTPQLRRARWSNASGWVLRGVSISPSYAQPYAPVTMVDVQGSASAITVENCKLSSVADSTSWTASDWMNVASNGVQVGGADVTVKGNYVKNVRFGITASGARALIDHNTVENFSADGMRGLGDDETFQYNLVKNSYVDSAAGDDNHDDGFQSWSVGAGGVGTGEVKNLVLRGNVIIDHENPAQPLKGSMQGIGCFDGTFVDWVVENNVVITNHWHGISLYGTRGSRIVNNTVIDSEAGAPGPAWIMVTAHKNGTPSQDVIVRNNLATDVNASGTNVTADHNVILKTNTLATYFVNPTPGAWDLRPLATSPAIDQGSTLLAPTLDADRIARPQGSGIDLGAYEWHLPGVVPADGGGAGAGAGTGAGAGAEPGATPGAVPGSADGSAVGVPEGAATGAAADGAEQGAQPSSSGDDAGGCQAAPTKAIGGELALVIAALLMRRRRRAALT